MPVDQKIVQDDIGQIGRRVIVHGRPGIADAPEHGSEGGGQGKKEEAGHLDLEIGRTRVQDSGRLRSHETDQGTRGEQPQKGEGRAHEEIDCHGLAGIFSGRRLIARALRLGHQGRGAYVHGHDHGHQQELRLGGKAHGSDGPGTQSSHHHQVHHGHQRGEHQLHAGGQRNPQDVPVDITGGYALGKAGGDLLYLQVLIGARLQLLQQGPF